MGADDFKLIVAFTTVELLPVVTAGKDGADGSEDVGGSGFADGVGPMAVVFCALAANFRAILSFRSSAADLAGLSPILTSSILAPFGADLLSRSGLSKFDFDGCADLEEISSAVRDSLDCLLVGILGLDVDTSSPKSVNNDLIRLSSKPSSM